MIRRPSKFLAQGRGMWECSRCHACMDTDDPDGMDQDNWVWKNGAWHHHCSDLGHRDKIPAAELIAPALQQGGPLSEKGRQTVERIVRRQQAADRAAESGIPIISRRGASPAINGVQVLDGPPPRGWIGLKSPVVQIVHDHADDLLAGKTLRLEAGSSKREAYAANSAIRDWAHKRLGYKLKISMREEDGGWVLYLAINGEYDGVREQKKTPASSPRNEQCGPEGV